MLRGVIAINIWLNLCLAFHIPLGLDHTQRKVTSLEIVNGDQLGSKVNGTEELGLRKATNVFPPLEKGESKKAYYYNKGGKVAISVNSNKKYFLLKSQTTKNDLVGLLKATGAVVIQFQKTDLVRGLNLLPQANIVKSNWAIIDNINPKVDSLIRNTIAKNILYKAPFLVLQNGTEVGLSHLFYVKLKDASDLGKLQKLSRDHNVTILGNNKFMPLWYTLSCSTKSSGNSLEVANKFFESGQFSLAEPDFLVNFQFRPMDP